MRAHASIDISLSTDGFQKSTHICKYCMYVHCNMPIIVEGDLIV